MFAAYVIVTWRGGGQITREALITARPRRDLQIAGLLARQRPKRLLAHSPTIRATCRPRSVVAAGSAASSRAGSAATRNQRLPAGDPGPRPRRRGRAARHGCSRQPAPSPGSQPPPAAGARPLPHSAAVASPPPAGTRRSVRAGYQADAGPAWPTPAAPAAPRSSQTGRPPRPQRRPSPRRAAIACFRAAPSASLPRPPPRRLPSPV